MCAFHNDKFGLLAKLLGSTVVEDWYILRENYPPLQVITWDLDTQLLDFIYLDYTAFLAEHLLLRHVWSRPLFTGSKHMGIMLISYFVTGSTFELKSSYLGFLACAKKCWINGSNSHVLEAELIFSYFVCERTWLVEICLFISDVVLFTNTQYLHWQV